MTMTIIRTMATTPTTAPMMMGRDPDDDEGDATVGDEGDATVYSEHERKNPITTETDCYNNGNQSSRKGSVDTT